MFTISKTFTFDAAHRLPDLPSGHKCARLHGHTYRVTVVLEGAELVPPGFVTDFADLGPFKAYLDAEFDHRFLNDVLSTPPTSELIAQHLAEWFLANMATSVGGRLRRVRVAETPSTWAEYEVARS